MSDTPTQPQPKTPPAKANTEQRSGLSGGRRFSVGLLVVIGSLLVLLSTFAVWADRQVLNTDDWVDTSSQVLENPKVQDALATYLVQQVYDNVDVQQEVKGLLPKDFKLLAGPASTGLKQLATEAAKKILASSAAQDAWRAANEFTHSRVVEVLEGGNTTISTENGEITLNVRQLVVDVANEVGIGSEVAKQIPASAGQIQVFKSDELAEAQDAVSGLQTLAWLLPVLSILFFAGAIALAPGARRRTLMACGGGIAIAGIGVIAAHSLVRDPILDSVVTNQSVMPAAQATWDIGTSLLVNVADAVIVYGIIFIVAGWFAGPARPAVWVRRTIAPFLRAQPGLVYAGAILIFLLIVIWGPAESFREPIPVLFWFLLMVLAIEVLRRETRKEFPDIEPGDPGRRLNEWFSGVGESVSKRWDERPRRNKQVPVPETEETKIESLERLSKLHQSGALSDEEFTTEKHALLGDSQSKPA